MKKSLVGLLVLVIVACVAAPVAAGGVMMPNSGIIMIQETGIFVEGNGNDVMFLNAQEATSTQNEPGLMLQYSYVDIWGNRNDVMNFNVQMNNGGASEMVQDSVVYVWGNRNDVSVDNYQIAGNNLPYILYM